MSLSVATIATGISNLSITGVTVKDMSGIPDQVNASRDCPILFPHPDQFLSGSNGEPATSAATFGAPADRAWIFYRTYKYVYLHAPVGAGRGISEHYLGMSNNADAIQTALTLLDLTSVDVRNINISDFAVLSDPSGSQFYGFNLTLVLREWINP